MRPAVQVFHSGMHGIPQLSRAGAPGELAELLYACGVTGFGEVTLDGLTQVGGVATASCSAGLRLADVDGMPHHVEIAGSTNGFDGVYTLSAPPGSTECTFPVDSSLPATATGTITLRRAGAGMARLASDGYREAYGFADPLAMPGFLLLDDSNTQYATVALAETLADPPGYATAAGLCPPSPLYWRKTDGGSQGGNRSFALVFWAGGFYLFVAWHGGWPTLHDPGYAGACLSRLPGDGFPGIVIGCPSLPSLLGIGNGFTYKNGGSQSGQYLQRGHAQTGGPVAFTKTGFGFGQQIGQGSYPGPNPVDNRHDAWGPIAISEGATNYGTPVRGFMPGLWDAANCQGLDTLDFLADMPLLPGRKILLVKCGMVGTPYMAGLDATGPWPWR